MRIVTLKFSDQKARLLMEVCEVRYASTIESLFDQIVDVELAALDLNKRTNRVLKVRPDFPPRQSSGLQEKRRLSAEKAQIILELTKQGVGAPQVAERVHCSVMTVHRILRSYEKCQRHVQEPQRVVGKRGAEISGFNNQGVKRQNA